MGRKLGAARVGVAVADVAETVEAAAVVAAAVVAATATETVEATAVAPGAAGDAGKFPAGRRRTLTASYPMSDATLEVWAFCSEFWLRHGVLPSMQEMANACIFSMGGIQRHLDKLIARGILVRLHPDGGRARSLLLTRLHVDSDVRAIQHLYDMLDDVRERQSKRAAGRVFWVNRGLRRDG